MTKQYATAASFRQGLERRLHTLAREAGSDLQRLRKKVAFERFLARLFAQPPHPWVLKGGYALEVRFSDSRSTKDLDLGTTLSITGSDKEKQKILLDYLQERATKRSDDFFIFTIDPTVKKLDAPPDGGFRFVIKSLLAGRVFVSFHLDIGMGDKVHSVERLVGTDWLAFCDIPPAAFDAISLEQQFAEKMHAMSVDRGARENSRVKDLFDAYLLIDGGLDGEKTYACLEEVFNRREKTVPIVFPAPPESWRDRFNEMAKEAGFETNFGDACASLARFWDKMLEMKV